MEKNHPLRILTESPCALFSGIETTIDISSQVGKLSFSSSILIVTVAVVSKFGDPPSDAFTVRMCCVLVSKSRDLASLMTPMDGSRLKWLSGSPAD